MGVDIVSTLLSALVIEEGLVINEHFVRDLTTTYLSVADDLIKMYADNAAFCGLRYDTNKEEAMVDNVFKDVIISAGDLLLSPYCMTERLNTFILSHDAFRPYIEQGLVETISNAGINTGTKLFETPQTVSWERVIRKLPNIITDIIDVIEDEKKLL
jgi:glucosyl-3-phosphoglycerate synthase